MAGATATGLPSVPLKIEVGKAQLRLDEGVTSQAVKDAVARAGFEVTAEH